MIFMRSPGSAIWAIPTFLKGKAKGEVYMPQFATTHAVCEMIVLLQRTTHSLLRSN